MSRLSCSKFRNPWCQLGTKLAWPSCASWGFSCQVGIFRKLRVSELRYECDPKGKCLSILRTMHYGGSMISLPACSSACATAEATELRSARPNNYQLLPLYHEFLNNYQQFSDRLMVSWAEYLRVMLWHVCYICMFVMIDVYVFWSLSMIALPACSSACYWKQPLRSTTVSVDCCCYITNSSTIQRSSDGMLAEHFVVMFILINAPLSQLEWYMKLCMRKLIRVFDRRWCECCKSTETKDICGQNEDHA